MPQTARPRRKWRFSGGKKGMRIAAGLKNYRRMTVTQRFPGFFNP
jgi:hypothetical protein